MRTSPLYEGGVPVLDVTSGGVTGGNFYEFIGAGDPGEPGFRAKLYWLPSDGERDSGPLTLTVSRPDSADPGHVLVIERPITTTAGEAWASSVPLPKLDRWRIEAEFGSGATGCFEFVLTSA